MGIAFSLAKVVAGASTTALRALGKTAGALPGKLACKIDPSILADLAPKITEGSILVVATNGKTTVTNLLADMLEADGRSVLCNRGGANMTQGLASVLLQGAPSAWAVFETDELYLAHILPQLRSRYVLLMDIFPDQLDRMGGTGRLVRSITSALTSCPETTLIYNADDPNCRAVAAAVPNPCVAVGAAGRFADNAQVLASDVEAQACPACSAPLFYAWRQYGPLGDYLCPACGFSRGAAGVDALIDHAQVGTDASAWDVLFRGAVFAGGKEDEGGEGSEGGEGVVCEDAAHAGDAHPAFASETRKDDVPAPEPFDNIWHVDAPYGAAYMVYNLTFALVAARLVGVQLDVAQAAINAFDPQNGRMERLVINGRPTLVNLAKNPVGFDQNIQLVCKHPEPCVLGLFVNNNGGDGVDASWVFKVNFEALGERVRSGNMRVFVGGMCTREVLEALSARGVAAEACEGAEAVIAAAETLPESGRIFLIANYTALPGVKAAAEAAAKAASMAAKAAKA